jgi:hypothetical protein
MIIYEIRKKFIPSDLCDSLKEDALINFIPDQRMKNGWNARTNRSLDFQNKMKEILSPLIDFANNDVTWINLSEYSNNRNLKKHTDSKSQLTFVIQLTEGFEGGELSIEGESISMEKGDCVYFNGKAYRHGVSPVTSGSRVSLNVWTFPKMNPII